MLNYSDIILDGNKMVLSGGAAVFAESASNLTVKGNVFTSPCVISAEVDPGKGGAGATTQQSIFLSHTHGATVSENAVVASGSCKQDPRSKSEVLGLGAGTSGILFDGHTLPPSLKTEDGSAQRKMRGRM